MRRSDQTCVICNERDLTEPEFQTLHQLTAANQRTILIFNKQDQYLPEERAAVLLSLRQRMQEMLSPEEVVGIAAFPVKVRQHQADGSVQEWMEQPAPDTKQPTQQLAHYGPVRPTTRVGNDQAGSC